MNTTVIVKNMVNGIVGINLPDIGLRVNWANKGVSRSIDFDKLKTAIYEPGVEDMFKSGILYIEDMEQKIALGLEEEQTTEPTNIKVFTEAQMKRFLTVMPIHDFKEQIYTYPLEQINLLVEYAIQNELVDYEKDKILQEITSISIPHAVELNQASKEA